ncbi:MAG: S26 family signal peptidase [Desulfitibacter sp. BRH_c19]|nr:MAG: S26 family signal peptidase [Desulfitibacter sp. BRH_c19]
MLMLKQLVSWIGHIFIAITLALIISIFILQPTLVIGESMESTLHNEDKIIINKLVRTLKYELNYGDIVVIDSRVNRKRTIIDDITDNLKNNSLANKLFNRENESIYWIKRVIAKSGDTIQFKEGNVYINGEILKESYIKEPAFYPTDEVIVVPQDYIYVMGDNRNYSKDSRQIGAVPIDNVIGTLILRF